MEDTISVTEDGLEIPEKYQDADKVIVRSRYTTFDCSSSFDMLLNDGRLITFNTDEFETECADDDSTAVQNSNLDHNQVSIKEYGSVEELFTVDL